MDAAAYQQLKKRADQARQARDRAVGQLDGVMERLEKEFGCDTIEEAEKMANRLEKEAVVAERQFNEAASEFEKEFNEHLKD